MTVLLYLTVIALLLISGDGAGWLSDIASFIGFGGKPAISKVPATDFFALSALDLNGDSLHFEDLRGKVMLITNVASS